MEVETYRVENGLTFEELGGRLGISKGHAWDICKGELPVSKKIAGKLEEVTGRPWHEWMAPPNNSEAAE